jgi:hypothetical protein
MEHFGKLFLLLGVVFLLIGGGLLLASSFPRWGRLPGDILIEREHFKVYLPLGTCIVISVVVSLLGWFFGRGR